MLVDVHLNGAWDGPGPLATALALRSWQVDIPTVLTLLVAVGAYAAGVRARCRDGEGWPLRRSVGFALGLTVVLLSTCSFVGVYARSLLWVYTLQVCLLLLVAPLLIGTGAPIALARVSLPVAGRARLARWGAALPFRALRLPGMGPLLLILVTAVLFFSPVLQVSLRNAVAFQAVHLLLLFVGLAMAIPVTDEGVSLSSLAYAAMLGLGLVEFVLDAVPGIVLRLHHGLLAVGYWQALHRPWGPSPIADQHLAGGVLWFFGEFGDLPYIAAVLVAWVRADTREATKIDRVLDGAQQVGTPEGTLHASASVTYAASPDARAPVVDAGTRTAPPDTDGPQWNRPWWEIDPSVFGEERARRQGWLKPTSPITQSPGRGPRPPGDGVAVQ